MTGAPGVGALSTLAYVLAPVAGLAASDLSGEVVADLAGLTVPAGWTLAGLVWLQLIREPSEAHRALPGLPPSHLDRARAVTHRNSYPALGHRVVIAGEAPFRVCACLPDTPEPRWMTLMLERAL